MFQISLRLLSEVFLLEVEFTWIFSWMYIGPYLKYQFFLSDLKKYIYIFVNRFSKNSQISSFVGINPMEAELLQADGQTDRYDEASRRFLQFC